MDLGLHGYVGRPQAYVCDSKGKIVFFHFMFDNWLSMDDLNTHDTCLSMSKDMSMYYTHAWSTGLNFG